MGTITFIVILVVGVLAGGAGQFWLMRRKKKTTRKKDAPWLTVNQLETLNTIYESKVSYRFRTVRGIRLWYTAISLSTIRSLAKRGYVDTASKGRIVATSRGIHRLRQPWPASQSAVDQKQAPGMSGSREGKSASAASQAASQDGEVPAL